MELQELFKKVNELTGKYPNLNADEIKELRILSNRLSRECSDVIYDMEVEKKSNK